MDWFVLLAWLVVGVGCVILYALMALFTWLVMAYCDDAFTGEGDGFSPALKRLRVVKAAGWLPLLGYKGLAIFVPVLIAVLPR
jgi:hypothetical protein